MVDIGKICTKYQVPGIRKYFQDISAPNSNGAPDQIRHQQGLQSFPQLYPIGSRKITHRIQVSRNNKEHRDPKPENTISQKILYITGYGKWLINLGPGS